MHLPPLFLGSANLADAEPGKTDKQRRISYQFLILTRPPKRNQLRCGCGTDHPAPSCPVFPDPIAVLFSEYFFWNSP